jgi:hypothetical protein
MGCLNQPNEPNNFVLVKFATKKTAKYFVELIPELGPDHCKIKIFACWILRYPDAEDTTLIDPSDTLLNFPHPVVSRSGR